MKRTQCIRTFAVVLPLFALGDLAGSEPAPASKSAIRLVQGGKLKLADLVIADAAVMDDNTIVVVGRKGDPEDVPPTLYKRAANGAIVDLARKASRPFTNGHKAGIKSVSIRRGRVATVSTRKDPVLRIWDSQKNKHLKPIEIQEIFIDLDEKYRGGEPPDEFDAVAWFHKRDQLVIAASEYLVLLEPGKLDDLSLLKTPLLTRRDKRENVILPNWFTKGPIAISPDDTWVACPVGWANVVFWNLNPKNKAILAGKPVDVSLAPKEVKDSEQWDVEGVTFSPAGKLIAWRSVNLDEESRRKGVEDVPHERQGVVQIELINVPEGKFVPLGLRPNVYPFSCAIDPTGTWLAAGCFNPPDKPRGDGITNVGELRIYNLSSKKLAYREQVEGLPLMWVSFTPNGKRVVCATLDGIVRWWDVVPR